MLLKTFCRSFSSASRKPPTSDTEIFLEELKKRVKDPGFILLAQLILGGKDKEILSKDKEILSMEKEILSKDKEILSLEKEILSNEKKIGILEDKLKEYSQSHAYLVSRGRLQFFASHMAKISHLNTEGMTRSQVFHALLQRDPINNLFEDCKEQYGPINAGNFRAIYRKLSKGIHAEDDQRSIQMLIPTQHLTPLEVCILQTIDNFFASNNEAKSISPTELLSMAYQGAAEDEREIFDEWWEGDRELDVDIAESRREFG
jgi:hypothetical protein